MLATLGMLTLAMSGALLSRRLQAPPKTVASWDATLLQTLYPVKSSAARSASVGQAGGWALENGTFDLRGRASIVPMDKT